MKQIIIAITMLFTLASTMQVTAQKHRHSANPTAVAPASTTATTTSNTPATTAPAGAAADTAGVEAFSDTTSVADNDSTYSTYGRSSSYSVNVTTPVDHILNSVSWNDVAGMFMIVCVVVIIFLLAPLFIIAVVFYFVNKSRKDKLKLAQMAIQNGQPIPDDILKSKVSSSSGDNDYQTGVRQMFTGVGLAIFLGLIIGKVGIGIGALVFFIGLGKWFIYRQNNNTGNDDFLNHNNSNQFNNNSNVRDYE